METVGSCRGPVGLEGVLNSNTAFRRRPAAKTFMLTMPGAQF